jgi:hypothetical protein
MKPFDGLCRHSTPNGLTQYQNNQNVFICLEFLLENCAIDIMPCQVLPVKLCASSRRPGIIQP